MGQKGIELVEQSGIKVAELVELLNKAFADEWLAYYQYWIGAQIAVGVFREDVQAEMLEHAGEELAHAQKLADRIGALGGTPINDPKDWAKYANEPYMIPTDGNTKQLLVQNIKSERGAIEVYKKLADFTKGKDPITHRLALEIMEDEIEHEEDLEAIADDIGYIKQ
jgi:bacterioferritin